MGKAALLLPGEWIKACKRKRSKICAHVAKMRNKTISRKKFIQNFEFVLEALETSALQHASW